MTDIVVLRQNIHGMAADGYADALRERLPDHDVALARTPEEERRLLHDTSVAAGFDVDAALLDEIDLDLFACSFAGTGHLPMDALREHGVAVTNASGVHAPNAAEHALGFVLAFARGFHEAWSRQARNEWRSYPTRELHDSTLAVVGLGAIGVSIVERANAFGAHTVGVRHSPEKGGPADEVVGYDAVHDAFARSDYVVLACPLTETTRGLVDEEAFRTLDPDAVLVNVARGPVVDTDALIDALRSNAIHGAALDVTDPEPLPPEHPLWGFANVMITPHNAGHTPAYWERLADILAENVRTAEETGRFEDLRNQVA